jgi:thioredoxin-dependent peroxiredoxin
MAKPKLGNLAPAFTLPDQHGESHSLKDQRGSIVLLYFYPKAMTPGCTVQACALRDHSKELKKAGVVVFGVSTDPVARLARFAEKHQLNFTLLSDEDHGVADKYGVWGLKKFMGREFMGLQRTSFIIDRDGKLRHIMDKVNTKTHHDDAMAWIRANL